VSISNPTGTSSRSLRTIGPEGSEVMDGSSGSALLNADKSVFGYFSQGMKSLNTNDESTKRFLLALHYVNQHCQNRQVTLKESGDIIFDRE
jgi:hypothetical protein